MASSHVEGIPELHATLPNVPPPVGETAAGFLLGWSPATHRRSYPMNIDWRHDIDRVLADAKAQNRNVLLDFSAAPM